MTPTQIDRYEVKKELGRGGMATVYLAYDPSFDRQVAIKVLPREFLHDPSFGERFKREVKIIAALEHPSIVPVYDQGEYEGAPYFVMRYMPGGSLSGRIEQGKLEVSEAVKIMQNLASAMAYAHRKGIVHRDLKSDNVLFDEDGLPYISDFGVASLTTSSGSLTGDAAIGTPAYMSPEQAQGERADHRADIYSLGVMIFEMLTGARPYIADTPMGVALKQITDPVPDILTINPELPAEMDKVIKTAMAKKKEERYPTAVDFAKALGEATQIPFSYESHTRPLTSQSLPAEIILMKEQPLQKKNPPMKAIAAGAAALVVVLAGIIFLVSNAAQPSPTPTPPLTSTLASMAEMTATPTVIPGLFTEGFDGQAGFDANWKHFFADGAEKDGKVTIENGLMDVALAASRLRYYAVYNPKTYNNVRIDMRVEALDNSISYALLLCGQNEGQGWYEAEVSSGGLYQILYVSLNADQVNTSAVRLANGGSLEIKTGKAVNEYSFTCNGSTLSLSANGVLIKTLEENRFQVDSGHAGFGVMSDKTPIKVKINAVSVSQP